MCEGGQIADVTAFGSSDIGWDPSEVCQPGQEGQGASGLLSGSRKVGAGGARMTTLISRAAGRAWKWRAGRAGCTTRDFQTLGHSILPPAYSLHPLTPRPRHGSFEQCLLDLPQVTLSALRLPCHSELTPPMSPFLKGTRGLSQMQIPSAL